MIKINIANQCSSKDIIINYFIEDQKKLFITAMAILNNYHLAEDALQETFIKISTKSTQLKNINYAKTWVTRILINECKDILRKNKNEILYLEDISETSFFNFEDEELRFYTLISNLDYKEKEILTLKYYNGLCFSEISKALKIPESTVKSRLYRALEKIKKDWRE